MKDNVKNDLAESDADRKHLQPDTVYIDLPEIKDIPGQENIRLAPFGQLSDTTISSADEEGKGLFEDDEDADTDNVTDEENELLQNAAETMGSEEDAGVQQARVDLRDDDGDRLNEADELEGDDLDVPGTEDDDELEELGEEDEENNLYSLGGDNHD